MRHYRNLKPCPRRRKTKSSNKPAEYMSGDKAETFTTAGLMAQLWLQSTTANRLTLGTIATILVNGISLSYQIKEGSAGNVSRHSLFSLQSARFTFCSTFQCSRAKILSQTSGALRRGWERRKEIA